MVEVLRQQSTHKYLGRLFCGDLTKRGETNLCHRLQCGWMKYSQLRQTLQNKNIPIRLRFKLFDATVTPTVLYSLSSTPLTSGQVGRLDACQRKMVRKIVGWTRLNDEDWSVTGSRMKAKLEAAMQLHPVKPWSEGREASRVRLMERASAETAPTFCTQAHKWQPRVTHGNDEQIPHRGRGRPLQRCF